ncbi:hypothetical protein H310_03396 [Aphanomyces invadans]|uniref:FYVE-type domain-containing protein n=1 Tax=Aphanomyces invadans TaxID=157072 RepID=A0A024UGW9_9STRA|nr:hypothetical protein H310_03396 [Aphanomyces invadans]ETW05676.1 hypothetical protein H310_03396 [Aphanomyces invadans]|eukprot:XP_008865453.1 hypothetical protein H310_03396 [Aphanomyces invadans]
MAITKNYQSVAADELKIRAEWVPDKARHVCYICRKAFNLVRRKHHCRVCGEIVCGSCTFMKTLTASPVASATHVKTCLWCPQRTRHARNLSSTSSSRSLNQASPAEVELLCRRQVVFWSSAYPSRSVADNSSSRVSSMSLAC